MFFPSSYGIDAISPAELSRRLAADDELFLLDVRTAGEHVEEAIEGSHLIPIHELVYRVDELPRDRDIVAYCRVGNRSAYAAAWLQRSGFRVLNLDGGIMQWRAGGGPTVAGVSRDHLRDVSDCRRGSIGVEQDGSRV